jgi:hypothetical protein
LNEYLREQLRVDRELNRVLELAARQSSARIRELQLREGDSIGARVRMAQLTMVLAELVGIQRDTWTTGIGPIIQRSYPRAQNAAVRAMKVLEEVVERALGERAAQDLLRSFQQTARSGLELDRVRRARALSPRVYRNAALAGGAVERQVRAGIIQGLSARELASSVRKYISPQTPGGVSYAAMRLARTELNNAFHEAQKIQGEAPFVRAIKWNLSKSHPKNLQCRCVRLANVDAHDLGKGRYPADRVPDKPHPHCLCFMTYDTISESEMLDLLPSLLAERRANRAS